MTMAEYTFVLTARWFVSITGYAVGDTEKTSVIRSKFKEALCNKP